MSGIPELFENNRRWARKRTSVDPDFFPRLSRQQAPQYLWIGCADSRVPANEIVGLDPGELFVHRNVANLVLHTDLNCLSVLQYAVEVLGVRHVIVCGHYGCGGVLAAMQDRSLGLIDNWLRHLRDLCREQARALDAIASPAERADRLCELNAMRQVENLSHTSIIQSAWARGATLSIHGWVYGLKDGLLRDLGVTRSSAEAVCAAHRLGM